MEILILVLVIGLIPAMIAKSKGRSFLLWYIYGVLLFIIALVHAILLKGAPKEVMVVGQGTDADEIRKLAKLRDDGLLTAAEFDAKKAQLLGIALSPTPAQ